METESHNYIQILGTIYDHENEGFSCRIWGNFFDMVNNMHFWGTLKIKKFLNMSIKVHEDEIFNRSVWHRWKARSS